MTIFSRPTRSGAWRFGSRDVEREHETGDRARLALGGDHAAVQLENAPNDDQAEPRAEPTPPRAVRQ